MKLYRAKVPVVAHQAIAALCENDDIEVAPENREEAEKDLVAIMEDFLRRDYELRELIKDHMADEGLAYNRYGKVRARFCEERGHPVGEDVERYLVRQFVENLMISPFIEEVFAEDAAIYKKLMEVMRSHDVDEDAIREEARGKIKNLAEGTVEYEIAMQHAVRDVKQRHGLIKTPDKQAGGRRGQG